VLLDTDEMNINFAGGLVTNEVYNPRSRGASGQYVRNCRVNGHGWLIPRKGRVRAEAPDIFSYADEYGGNPLGKIAPGTVRYAEAGSSEAIAFAPVKMVFQAVKVDTSQVEQAFPTQQGDTGEPPPILSPRTVIGEHSDPITVETVRVVNAEDQFGEFERDPGNSARSYRARVHTLKVVHLDEEKIAVRFRITGDINLKVVIVDYGSKQPVRYLRDTTYLDGGENDREPNSESPRYKEVIWDGRNDFGERVSPNSYSVAFEEAVPITRRNANGEELPISEYDYRRSWLPFDIRWETLEISVGSVPDATHVDIFVTADPVSEHYFWVARLPIDRTVHYQFPVPDVNTESVLTFEDVEWIYIAANEFRAYTAEADSNRVYLSHFNPGTGERLYQNFTDFIDLDLQDGYITGLHFLRDTHLIIYASNQIQILATDPLPELHSVIDFITPRDDKGEYIGCISPDSIVDMGGVHYFLATDKRIYRYDGSNLREMSDKIHGVLAQVIELENAVGFSHDQHYLLSIEDTTLVYDLIHNVWWQDDFAVSDAMKDRAGNVYGVIDGETFQLYTGETDDGQPIRRIWQSHPYYGRIQQKWESIHVFPQAPAVIDVEAYTEFNRAEGRLDVDSLANPWAQRMGCLLRGRTLTVEIQTESTAAIDRITVNERVRG